MPTSRLGVAAAGWAMLIIGLCIGDHYFHVRHGILIYHWGPQIGGQSVWVWPIFAIGSAMAVLGLIGAVSIMPRRWFGDHSIRWSRVVLSAAIVMFGYWVSGQVGNAHPFVLAAIFAALWGLRLAFTAHRVPVVIFSVFLAVLGPMAEGSFAYLGLFTYIHVDVFETPLWLAALYLHLGFAFYELADGVKASPTRPGPGGEKSMAVVDGNSP